MVTPENQDDAIRAIERLTDQFAINRCKVARANQRLRSRAALRAAIWTVASPAFFAVGIHFEALGHPWIGFLCGLGCGFTAVVAAVEWKRWILS